MTEGESQLPPDRPQSPTTTRTEEPLDDAEAPPSVWRRFRRTCRQKIWPLATLYVTLAVVSTITSSAGRYVFDNRFDQYWNPARRLSKYLIIWDSTRGLGRVREEFWPGTTIPIAIYRWLGAPPWMAEHLWHATLLVIGGLGAVAFLRVFRPRLAVEHVFVGLVYMFNPYSATFLIPSNLYYHYAVAPWLITLVTVGVQHRRPWRWAAGFALIIFSIGNTDLPGLVYTAAPVLVVIAYLIFVERTTSLRMTYAFLWRAAVLSTFASAAALFKVYAGAGALSQRLLTTESPEVVGLSASWGESFRGLGLWLIYFRDQFGPTRPQAELLLTSPLVIIGTFALPMIALTALWLSRHRQRVLFGGMMVVGVLLMVGGYPPTNPSPYGRTLLLVQEVVPSLAAVRATYKAGAGYALGMSALFATAVALGVRICADRWPRWRMAPVVAASLILATAAAPFWSGNLYDPEKQLDDVPQYWIDSMEWLNEQPGDSRVLIVPGTTRAPYRWGWPGDDIHDAFLTRPHVVDIAITLSNPYGTDLIRAIDDGLGNGVYVQGTLAPIARRLGIEYVMIRNDLRWELADQPRPAAYEKLRNDPDLTLEATFGDPGEFTTDPSDIRDEPSLEIEQALPPIEIYRVNTPTQITRLEAEQPTLLLSGSGEGWFTLARYGYLDGWNPIVYTAGETPDRLVDQLQTGSPVFITDSNRRRLEAVFTYSSEFSRTLSATETADRDPPDLFLTPGSQTVATFTDASSVTDTGLFRPISGWTPELRAANAVDGDPETQWIIGPLPDPRTRTIRVDFANPTTISGTDITLATGRAGQKIARADLRFSDGTSQPVNLITGSFSGEFAERTTDYVELAILEVTGTGFVGISDWTFSGTDLDLVEYQRVPDDLFRAAKDSEALTSALIDAPISYLFTRQQRTRDLPIESTLRREFETVGSRNYTLTGTLNYVEGAPSDTGDACFDVGIRIDDETVVARLGAPRPDPLAGIRQVVDFTACEPVTLGPGTHRISSEGAPADTAVLTSGDLDAPSPPPDGETTLLSRRPAEFTSRVVAPAGGIYISGENWGEAWRAELNGADLGKPRPMDGQNAWLLPEDSVGQLRVYHPVQQSFNIAIAVTALGVITSVLIVVWKPRRS